MKKIIIKYFLKEYDNYRKSYNKKNHQNINEIRKIIKDHPPPGKVKKFPQIFIP